MRQVEYESSVGEIKRREVPESVEDLSQILLGYEKKIQEEQLRLLPNDSFTLDLERYDIYVQNQKVGNMDISSRGIDTRRIFDLSERNKGMNLGVPIYLLGILQSISSNYDLCSLGAKEDALKIWNRLEELGIAKKVGVDTYVINKEIIFLLNQVLGTDDPLKRFSNLVLETKLACFSKLFKK